MNTIEHKIIEGSLELSSSQLELLLTLLEVEKLPGINGNRFLQDQSGAQQSEWNTTTQELILEGWLIPDEEGKQSINPGLIRVVLNMANAPHIVVTNMTKEGQSRGVVHYFGSEFVIEMANGDQSHQLTLLESKEVAIGRICHYAEIHSTELGDRQKIILTLEESNNLQAGELLSPEKSPLMKEITSSWGNPLVQGEMALIKNNWDKGFAGSIYRFVISESSAWGATSINREQVRYEQLDEDAFSEVISAFLL